MKDLEPFVEDVEYTNVGNVLAHIPGSGRKVLVFGHADEIAYYVLSITEDGFLHLSRGRANKLGYPYTIIGQKALVLGDNKDVRGAFVTTAGHVLQPKEREAPLEPWKILVDLGASSKEEISIGGAWSLSRRGFNIAIALDIGIAGDYPTLQKGRMPVSLGDGPVIAYRDSGIVYNIDVIKELREAAERNNIPYQQAVFEHYVSDSTVMMSGGTRPNLLTTPCRYSHSPVEMMHLDDIENTARLLYHYVTD